MARINNLTNFLSDVADAIRSKKGTSSLIPAEDFDTEIINLPSGGSTLQSKSITIRSNGSQTVSPDSGYDGLSSVSITTNVPGGSSGDFVYDNWIAYGTSTPDANDYKYWFNVDTTPANTPLRYVSNYKANDYYTGELAEVVDNRIGSDIYKFQSNFLLGAVQNDANGNYYFAANGQNVLGSNVDLYKYTYTNQLLPSPECIGSDYSTSFGNFNSKGIMTSTSIYGCWAITPSGEICGTDGSQIRYWNTTYNQAMTWAYCNASTGNWLSSKYKGIGMYSMPDGKMLLFRTNNTTVEIKTMTYNPSNMQTPALVKSITGLSNMNNYSSIRIDDDNIFLAYKRAYLSLSSSSQKVMYNYNYSTNTWTKITLPTSSGELYFRYVAPENKYIFIFSNLPYTSYTLENGVFVEMGNGNLFNACIKYNYGAIGYLNGTTFRACIPVSDFKIKDTVGNINTYDLNTGDNSTYIVIEGTTTKNYTFGHETLENYNSTNNVLLISNYKGSTPYQSYGFYPRPSSEIFLWLYRNGTTKFIYNKTEHTLQVSVNGAWTTNDTENNIR